MIELQSVTKYFGNYKVIDNLSFTLNRGQIMGFLGPNGAGKTTTMRLLTGQYAPTSGSVCMRNKQVLVGEHHTRKGIGYLPENNPLYDHLRMYEYLDFIASAKGVEDRVSEIKKLIFLCDLKEKVGFLLSDLSKGWRQRVGLAAALIGDPDILILDEPTAGLDPNQADVIKRLIKDLGREKTILFSTHLLKEVETICDRVLIINKGVKVMDGLLEDILVKQKNRVRLLVNIRGNDQEICSFFETREEIIAFEKTDRGYSLSVNLQGKDMNEYLFHECVRRGWVLREMTSVALPLDELFMELTKNESTPEKHFEPLPVGL